MDFFKIQTPNHRGDNLNIHFMDLQEWMNEMAKYMVERKKYRQIDR